MREVVDPYNEIAILEPQDFELRGSGLAVPLHFKPDSAYVVRFVMRQEGDFITSVISDSDGFEELCEGTYPRNRFTTVFSDIRFTLDALGSTLILNKGKRDGLSKVYTRNPLYSVTDDEGILGSG